MNARTNFRLAAQKIAANRNEESSSAIKAFSKLFIQEKRNWKAKNAPRVGWKRGELVEWFLAKSKEDREEEWGDVGYYLAQSWWLIWIVYFIFTEKRVISRAVTKFQIRAGKN